MNNDLYLYLTEGIKEGTYVAVKPTDNTIAELYNAYYNPDNRSQSIFDSLGGKALVPEDWHCTILYSLKTVEGLDCDPEELYTATFKGYDLFGPNKDVLVMLLDCPSLETRNKYIRDNYETEVTFPEYKPHITLVKDIPNPENIDLSNITPFFDEIVLSGEYSENLKD